jgi:hypothetical protein
MDHCAGGPQCGIQGLGHHKGVAVQFAKTLVRCLGQYAGHIIRIVHPVEMLALDNRRILPLQNELHARAQQLILDRTDPGRALGVTLTHIVEQTVGMGNKGDRHEVWLP